MTVCANCGSPQGPFERRSVPGKAICKAARGDFTRIAECVKRREKIDSADLKAGLRHDT